MAVATDATHSELEPIATDDRTTLTQPSLLKAMHWYDGFVMALSNPGFLIANIGYTTGQLGALGALAVWLGSMVIAALQNKIYTEPATMFPDHAGGISMYAFEGWRRRFTLAGPMAAVGYWAGWSAVLAIFGLTIGSLVQAEWFPSQTWSVSGVIHLDLPRVIAITLILVVWLINALGLEPVKMLGYLTSALLMVPLALFALVPFFLTDFTWTRMSWGFNGAASSGLGAIQLALVWLYLNAWSAYGVEVCATFAPEYHDTKRDTQIALRRSAIFSLAVYALLPLALGGTVDQGAMAASPLGFYTGLLNREIGGRLAGVVIVFMIASFLLGMNAASAGGARTLYGMSKSGMTLRWLGHLNRHHVPNRGLYVDMTVNVLAVLLLPSTVAVLAASNFGYVLCHILALSAVVLLRHDHPQWPRPLWLAGGWVVLAGVLATFNTVLLLVGSLSFGLTGYGGFGPLVIGLMLLGCGCLLYVYRQVVEDKRAFRLREPAQRGTVEPRP